MLPDCPSSNEMSLNTEFGGVESSKILKCSPTNITMLQLHTNTLCMGLVLQIHKYVHRSSVALHCSKPGRQEGEKTDTHIAFVP